MKNLGASAQRNCPPWYGWKIRLVWMISALVGMFAADAQARCRNWATAQAYRLASLPPWPSRFRGSPPYAAIFPNRGTDRRLRQWCIRCLAGKRPG